MEPSRSSGITGLARLFWMVGGPAILFFLAAKIAQNANVWMAPASVAFLFVLVGLVIARRFDPHDGYGEPATPTNIQRYTVAALIAGLGLWLIANVVGIYWSAV